MRKPGAPTELVVSGAKGIYVQGEDGCEYLDSGAGLWCSNIGASHPEMVLAAKEAFETNSYTPIFGAVAHRPILELSEKLLGLLDGAGLGNLSAVFFGNSGSDANESAVKIARLFHACRGNASKQNILSLKGGYHGLTGTVNRLAGIDCYHTFEERNMYYLSCPHPLHFRGEGGIDAVVVKLLDEAQAILQKLDANTVAAFIAEPVLGVGGVVIPPESYFPRLQALLKKNDVLLIADEVITGMGRTGEWFASPQMGITPDILTLAKGLTSGYFPLSATVVSRQIWDVLELRDTAFMHGFTYSGHPVGASLALKNIDILEEDGLVEQARIVGSYLGDCLAQALEAHPFVGEVRSLGQMHGVEYVADRGSLTFFPPDLAPHRVVSAMARKQGLLLRPLPHYHVNSFSPALNISRFEVEKMVEIFMKALKEAMPLLNQMAEGVSLETRESLDNKSISNGQGRDTSLSA